MYIRDSKNSEMLTDYGEKQYSRNINPQNVHIALK